MPARIQARNAVIIAVALTQSGAPARFNSQINGKMTTHIAIRTPYRDVRRLADQKDVSMT